MRLAWLMCASLGCGAAAAAEAPVREPIVVEVRLGARVVETIAWRDADGSFVVDRETMQNLGLRMPAPDAAEVALSAISGLSYRWDAAQTALVLTCASTCFDNQILGLANDAPAARQDVRGGFLNLDLAATRIGGDENIGALFELGLFGPSGLGDATWTVDSGRSRLLRLETRWTLNDPARRRSIRIGDSFTRGGVTGAPMRFGGVQIASNFALDPGFVPYPVATLHGEAATPSTVDLYVDGALRLRQRVDAGPFAIVDPPLLTGAGVAQIVVTDALGRQYIEAHSFYTSPVMLRPGLAEYSFAVGAERENFARQSADYGRGFISAFHRYGVTPWLTGEARIEAGAEAASIGFGVSTAASWLGQVDGAVAVSTGAGDGFLARVSALQDIGVFTFYAETQAASADFQRFGARHDTPQPRLQAVASLSADFDEAGVASLTFISRDARDHEDVRTLSLSYAPPPTRWGRLDVSALYVDAAEADLSIGVRFTAALGAGAGVSAYAESDSGAFSAGAAAQRPADPGGGFGWRARASSGARERTDVGLTHIGAQHEASLEINHTPHGDGLRAQYATSLAWIDGAVFAARPIRESFALVDVGLPNVRVYRDHRAAGVTDLRGRLLLTGLRPYQINPISVDMDELPFDAQLSEDEIDALPPARSGVVVRFARGEGQAGEAHIVDALGAPLPEGAILVREMDGARFPVGTDGRVYLTGVTAGTRFSGDNCVVIVAADDLNRRAVLQCRSA